MNAVSSRRSAPSPIENEPVLAAAIGAVPVNARPERRAGFLPPERLQALLALLLAAAVLYLPTYWELYQTVWQNDEQGHGPIILGLSFWLLWRERVRIFGGANRPRPGWGFALLGGGLLLYVVGRSQEIPLFEVGSSLPVFAAILLFVQGGSALRRAWFPLFFLVFMVPLPQPVVQFLTVPLKQAVSYVAELLLNLGGYPVGRSGVTLSIGTYRLMVADACAGLNSMFTLESLGLIYMKLMDYKSPVRNTLLAVMIIPISFVANVVRVLVLVLVTYYFGDEAGQGFTHWFAGMVLFTVALVAIIAIDRPLGWLFGRHERARGLAARPSTGSASK